MLMQLNMPAQLFPLNRGDQEDRCQGVSWQMFLTEKKPQMTLISSKLAFIG